MKQMEIHDNFKGWYLTVNGNPDDYYIAKFLGMTFNEYEKILYKYGAFDQGGFYFLSYKNARD